MKLFLAISALLATALAAPPPVSGPFKIVRQDQEVNFDGSYKSSYETENGIIAEEQGSIKNANNPEAAAAEVTGLYKYIGPDGSVFTTTYIANENGFQPQGDHLPVGPDIPIAIVRSLEYNAAHPEQEEPAKRSG